MNEHMNRQLKGISFVILFVILTVVLFFALTNSVAADSNHYKRITVEKGDSLWSIAEQYHKVDPKLSEQDFIAWVERENGIDRDFIKPDQKLTIPVPVRQ